MIGVQERPTTTYDATIAPARGIRNLYAGLSRSVATHNSTVIFYDLIDDVFNNQVDFVATSGSYPPLPFWKLPVAPEIPVRATPQRLSLKQAQKLALEALTSAEERRQWEREAEAKYWSDLD